jgi:hypothetical protein
MEFNTFITLIFLKWIYEKEFRNEFNIFVNYFGFIWF